MLSRKDTVHKKPSNKYQRFVKAFVFLKSDCNRQKSVETAEKFGYLKKIATRLQVISSALQ